VASSMADQTDLRWYRLGTITSHSGTNHTCASIFPIRGTEAFGANPTRFYTETQPGAAPLSVEDSLAGKVLEKLVAQIIARNP
jgi:hypothetical protein